MTPERRAQLILARAEQKAQDTKRIADGAKGKSIGVIDGVHEVEVAMANLRLAPAPEVAARSEGGKEKQKQKVRVRR